MPGESRRRLGALGRQSYPAGTGRCQPGSTADCRRTEECKHERRCFYLDGRCQRPEDSSCQHSHGCRTEGLCAFRQERCAAATGEGCRAAEACTKHNRCRLGPAGRCVH